MLTRVVSPTPFQIPRKPMEVKQLDKVLATLRGRVYDIRDYMYGGIHHKYKKRLYDKLRSNMYRKKTTLANFTYNPQEPYLDPDITMTENNTKVTGFLNVCDNSSDSEYDDYCN